MEDDDSSCFSDSSEGEEYLKCNENIADPRVEKTVREMLDSRGYEITQELQDDEVKSLVASKKIVNNCSHTVPDINVIFATDYMGGEEVKFNIKIVNSYIAYINARKLKHVLIIHQGKITSRVKDTISNYQILKKIKIEVFTQNELKFNITKHRLVPKHEVMTKEESKEFKLKYGNKFNSILVTDPVSRFYGYEKGDIVKIYRNSGIIIYRIVI
jgi:DNA-directed RNA polymerase I, II, and III subunit RPABC1